MRRRGVYCTLLLVGVLGCSSEALPEAGEASSSVQANKEALYASPPPSDDGSRPAIIVEWRERAAERKDTQSIDVTVENTSDLSLSVDLAVVATDDGQAITQAIESRTLQPHSSQEVPVPLKLIPVQTAGADTAVWVSAAYSVSTTHPFTNTTTTLNSVAISEPRRITFSDDFAAATARDYRAQLAHNNALGDFTPAPVKRRLGGSGEPRRVASSPFTTSFRSIPADAPGTPPVLDTKAGAP